MQRQAYYREIDVFIYSPYHQIVTLIFSKNRNDLKNFRKICQKIANRNDLVVGTVRIFRVIQHGHILLSPKTNIFSDTETCQTAHKTRALIVRETTTSPTATDHIATTTATVRQVKYQLMQFDAVFILGSHYAEKGAHSHYTAPGGNDGKFIKNILCV